MRALRGFLLICIAGLFSCTPPPPVNESREVLWKEYAHQSIDKVILAWGPPAAETKLTNGSRMLTYNHATTYDALSPYERTSGCEVSFLAPPPHYHIENISMKGEAFECHQLALGRTGVMARPYIPPPPVFYPSFYYR